MKLKLFLISVLFQAVVLAQSGFKVDFDYARFNYDDSSNYVEIYYSFYQPNLRVEESAEQQKSISGQLNIRFVDLLTDSTVISKTYEFNSILESADTNSEKSLTGNLGFLVPVGNYNVYLMGMDGNDATHADSVNFEMTINTPPERYWLSDLTFASSIKESQNTSSIFYKNTYEVVPNPSSIYGEPLPVLYFYSEIYNVDENVQSQTLKIDHILLDSQNEVYTRKSKYIPRGNESVVEVGAINVSKAPSGIYLLVVSVSDTVINQTIYTSKRLFVYNPSIIDTSSAVGADQDVMSSEFISMSDEELDEVFAFSRYVATSSEVSQWQKLSDLQAKRTFLFNFWKARDDNINTPVNENKRDYFNRVERANKQYSTMQRKGWKTDRGRVFIIYGEPSEVERYPNQVDTKPYEIWQYDQIEGGVIFIFADMTGFSDYQLVHSTHRNELRDDNWPRKIQTY
jgi:GWxTD domain-containing protein